MRSGGSGDDPHTKPFMTTADAVANKARIQRGDKATEVDEALNGGAPAFHTAMAKQGVMHGIAVGGCCELSTSAHHLVAKIGEEQGYKLAESSGMDIEDAITIAGRVSSKGASPSRSGATTTNTLSRAAATQTHLTWDSRHYSSPTDGENKTRRRGSNCSCSTHS